MQSYSNPASRNTMRAAGDPMKTGAAMGGGGNQTQGAGTLPSKVSVPMPGTDTTQTPYKGSGGVYKAPMGFNNGLINGKI
jgi:hypothetical protein